MLSYVFSVQRSFDAFKIEPDQTIIRTTSDDARRLYTHLQSINDDLQKHSNAIEQLNNRTTEFEQRTSHMERHIRQAVEKLERINAQVSELHNVAPIRAQLKQSVTLKESTDGQLANATQLLRDDLAVHFTALERRYGQAASEAEHLNDTIQTLISLINETIEQNRRVRADVPQATRYVQNLTQTSVYLTTLYETMKQQNNVTLITVSVHRDIIDTVNRLDTTSTGLRANLSTAQEHLYRQQRRIEQLERDKFNQSLSTPSDAQARSGNSDSQRLQRAENDAINYNASLVTSEKLLLAYRSRIDELKFSADKLEPESARITSESEAKTNEVARLQETIDSEEPPSSSSSSSDESIQTKFSNIINANQFMKRWGSDVDQQLLVATENYNSTAKEQNMISQMIADIRRLVEESRSIVSSVRVGAQFNRTSAASLHRPFSKSHAHLSKQHSKLAVSFRTTEPNGLLAYSGNENDERHMLLRLNQDGKVEFTYDIGQPQPTSIVSPQALIDNQWYDVTGERTGPHGQLTVVDVNGNSIFVGNSDAENGGQSMLDLSEENAVLLVGGVPSGVVLKQEYPSFAGSISNVRLDDRAVSLWNIRSSTKYNEGSIPSPIHREALPGIGLKGDGHVIFSKRRLRRLEHSFTLTIIFKTNAPNGLLFANTDNDKRYFAVQIMDSRPEIVIETGSGVETLRLEGNVHDNQVHRLQIKKQDRELIIQLDDREPESLNDADGESRIESGDGNVYVGKYPGHDSLGGTITGRGFSGCIQSILVDRIELSLKSEYFKSSENVESTCSMQQILRTVQFNYLDKESREESFVEVSQRNLTVPWAITARLHSSRPSGTLIYMDDENRQTLIVSFEQHQLLVKHKDLPVIGCDRNLSTIWWNYISIYRDAKSYRLYLNDTECGEANIESGSEDFHVHKSIYIGGVPLSVAENMPRLVGCIGDVNIDGSLINFINVLKMENAEPNCQSDGLSAASSISTNTNQGSLAHPVFVYNATQPTYQPSVISSTPATVPVPLDTSTTSIYPNGPQLKLLQFNDEADDENVHNAVWPSVESITSTSTNPTSMKDDEGEDDEEVETPRQRRSCTLPTIASNDRGRDVGYRFGDDHRESRAQITVDDRSITQSMSISFHFRTRFAHGLLFYSGSDGRLIAVVLERNGSRMLLF